MTVQEGLNELTLLAKRIEKQVQDMKLYSFTEPIDAKAKLQSVTTLASRRTAIQYAIAASNTVTTVTVADTPMTVTEAMYKKNSYTNELDTIIKHVGYELQLYTAEVRNMQKTEDETIRTLLESAVANGTVLDEEATRSVLRKPLKSNMDITETYTKITKEQEDFLSAVDLALTVSNVQTEVIIES